MEGKVRAKDIRSYIASTENKVNIILQAFTLIVNLLHPRPSLFISGLFSFFSSLFFFFNSFVFVFLFQLTFCRFPPIEDNLTMCNRWHYMRQRNLFELQGFFVYQIMIRKSVHL